MSPSFFGRKLATAIDVTECAGVGFIIMYIRAGDYNLHAVMYYTIERESSHHTNATITARARDHLAGHGRLIDFRK